MAYNADANYNNISDTSIIRMGLNGGNMQEISITTEGIQKNLKKFRPLDALCEYIWNGFDAQASVINIELYKNVLGIINKISVADNGTGIKYEELGNRFKPFNDSEKAVKSKINSHSLPHGRQGIGRLTFFAFAQAARWNTVYEKEGKHFKYYIAMQKDSLNQYDDNNGEKPQITDKETGTEVVFTQILQLSKEEIIGKIKEEFFWFLELNKSKNYQIIVDDSILSYDDFVIERTSISLKNDYKNIYDITYVQWNQNLGQEYSKFYYIDSANKEKYKEATRLNKKSDEFYHSIYIKSSYFDNFFFEKVEEGQMALFHNRNEDEYKLLISEIYDFVYKRRRRFLKEASDKFINKLVDAHVYPDFNTNSIMDSYRKNELDNLVGTLYVAKPKIFTNLSDDNKKITIGLLKLIMDSEDKESLFTVLKKVIDLDEEELKELSDVLKYTTLSRVAKVVKLIEDRQQVIQTLKELVFTKELFAKEVPHIQTIVENHYWLFGEQYSLITAAEPDFELALKGLIKAETGEEEEVEINHEDKNKEMDIFMIRQNRKGDVTENVVVELKRPSIMLGDKELNQVKRYLRVIRSNDRFNMGNVKWTFYLVGNKYNTSGYIEGELENNSSHGDEHLVYSIDNGKTKIYVLKWSEVFDEFSKRYEFLLEKLKLEKELWLKESSSADEAVQSIKDNSATLDGPIIPKRSTGNTGKD